MSVCHGYACGCRCPACKQRVAIVQHHVDHHRRAYTRDGKLKPRIVKRKPTQPWETKAV